MQLISASDLGPEGREFEPWPVHPRCVLRQNTNSRGFSFERNCVLRRWESETLKSIINHKVDKVN